MVAKNPAWSSPATALAGSSLWEHRCDPCKVVVKHFGPCDDTCAHVAGAHAAHGARHGPLKG